MLYNIISGTICKSVMIIKPYNVDGYFEVTEVFLFQSAGQSTILVLRYYHLCVTSILQIMLPWNAIWWDLLVSNWLNATQSKKWINAIAGLMQVLQWAQYISNPQITLDLINVIQIPSGWSVQWNNYQTQYYFGIVLIHLKW